MSFGTTIKRIRQAKGLTQDEIDRRTGDVLSPGTLSRIENEKTVPNVSLAKRLCDALEVSIADVFIESEGGTPVEIRRSANLQVPLVSWVQAGNFNDSPAATMAEGWVPFNSMKTRLYALKVRGDSMTSLHGMSFPDGVNIIVDPEKNAENKDFVIVRVAGSDEATFKQLIIDGPFVYLRPLNSIYPTIQITEDHRLSGVVIGMNWKSPDSI